MDKHYNQLPQKVMTTLQHLNEKIPESIKSFSNLSNDALKQGALNRRTKEIAALSMAIILNSEECITFHLQSLIKEGFSYDELLELTSVATYMGGGPALISASNAIEAYKALTEHNQAAQPAIDNEQKVPASSKEATDNISSMKGYE